MVSLVSCGHLLLLAFCSGVRSRSFRNGAELRQAILDRKESDSIGAWDVSAVTDMSALFKGLASFNEDISQWNTSSVNNMSDMFSGASAFNQTIGVWDTSAVLDMRSMFRGASVFNQPLGAWDTSAVGDMSCMFYDARAFNRSIGAWNTSAVTNMSFMFRTAAAFNQPIGLWDTASVKDLCGMFLGALAFNQPIGLWNTSSATDMSMMFYGDDPDSIVSTRHLFNQPIGSWDTRAVRDMSRMFCRAKDFNQAVGSWNTSAVTDMSFMFADTANFNQPIGDWDTAEVVNMRGVFSGSMFNQPIGRWNTSAVTDMSSMFEDARVFNQSLDPWDTSAVTTMRSMFQAGVNGQAFNRPIGSWNTSAVTDMSSMFEDAKEFNQPIGNWDTSSVRSMEDMFRSAVAFNQPIGSWNTSAVVSMKSMFYSPGRKAAFNQDIGCWDTSAVRRMDWMFYSCAFFNQPLGSWDTSAVVSMREMFAFASAFNQPIGSWNTSKVRTMRQIFRGAKAFNRPIGAWDTSKVRVMTGMFQGAEAFNQPIGSWNTSGVVYMSSMFEFAEAFDQPVGAWDTSAVRDMSSMFDNAEAFNQPLGLWNTSSVTDVGAMLKGARSFNQPIGSWDVDQAKGASNLVNNLSPCVRLSVLRAWGSLVTNPSAWKGAKCGSCPCPRDEACVDGMCAPVNSGFVDLGLARWANGSREISRGALGFRGCAAACQEQGECSGFRLEGPGCFLRSSSDPFEKDGEGEEWAFQKHTCATFTCPPGSRHVPSGITSVSEAQCCSCTTPGWFQDLAAVPALKCQACPAGRAPAGNGSACDVCALGHYAWRAAPSCAPCGPGTIPTSSRVACTSCPAGKFSPGAVDVCQECSFPFVILADYDCIWWHLPLLAVGLAAIFLAGRFLANAAAKRRLRKKQRWEAAVAKLCDSFRLELWDETPSLVSNFTSAMGSLGIGSEEVAARVAEMRAEQSASAGVSMRYLLSREFQELARERTSLDDPSFEQMKAPFWFGPDPIGVDVPCPRDGRPGCALVDWIPRADRRQQTHFMSWVWRYRISQVRSALQVWQAHASIVPHEVFFFMCFFVNNQHRILVEQTQCGSDDLGEVFRSNLLRCGQMVAVLDTWQEPLYLRRIWTIYEQYVASSLHIPTTFLMPETSTASLRDEIHLGQVGITRITGAVSQVDSEKATATNVEDEINVKKEIQEGIGFSSVDKHVTEAMVRWIGGVTKNQFRQLIEAERAHATEDGFSV